MKKKPSAPLIGSSDAAPKRGLTRRRPAPLALEPRLIFDADSARPDPHVSIPLDHAFVPEADRLAAHTADFAPEKSAVVASELASAPLPKEVLFIDTSVADWQTLASQVRSDVQVFLLDPTKDAFVQIESALQGVTGITSLHIVSHGEQGALVFGTTSFNAENIDSESAALSAIGQSLAPGADILLYGCDVAAGSAGATLIGRIAEQTGADVAASSDLTGSSRVGGNWILEKSTGTIESDVFLTDKSAAAYDNWLGTIALDGKSGWTAIMYGPNQDPVGDSQAGAADTDIVGDATHGSLYTAYDDAGTGSTADDMLAFRLRIDNPTSSTNFSGVAIVGLDVNNDGRIDLFISVDGRNNTQAVRLLDPGTGANISPSTTSTQPLPTGWLANNGVYPFSNANYSVIAVSSATDPNWNGVTDLGGDGHTDVFVSWKIPVADIAAVLAKASPVDRNGVYGPRGAAGIAGYTKDTVVRYVAFTQTQPGPINGDLDGVGASYDKNATFSSLGAFTAPMTASSPVSVSEVVKITSTIDANGLLNASEDDSVALSGTATANGWVRVTISDTDSGTSDIVVWTQANGSGVWSISGRNLSGLAEGTLTFTADLVTANSSNTRVSGSISDSASVTHDTVAPVIGVNALNTSGRPTISGTSTDVPVGSVITVTIDPNGDGVLSDLVTYSAVVGAGGIWSVNTSVAMPVSGTVPASGFTAYATVTATGQDAAANSASATAIDRPTVNSFSTQSTTPTISGTWHNTGSDTISVTVNGVTYTSVTVSGNTWSVALANNTGGTALVAGNSYDVVVTVTRSGTGVTDTTTGELTIVSGPSVDITGSGTATTSNSRPTLTGTATAGAVVVLRIDPSNEDNLSDAVTYSVTADGSGNWSINLDSATPISGVLSANGLTGTVGLLATVTDTSNRTATDTQALTITTPSISIASVAGAYPVTSPTAISSDGILNATEDNSVVVYIAGTNLNTSDTIAVTVSDGVHTSVTGTATYDSATGKWKATLSGISNLNDGTNALTVSASFNSGQATDSRSISHDSKVYATVNSTETSASTPSISGTADVTSSSISVQVDRYTKQGGSILYKDTVTYTVGNGLTFSNGVWSASVSQAGGTFNNTGEYLVITVTGTDSAGNSASATGRVTKIANAGTPATVTISTIAGDNTIDESEDNSVTISGTTSTSGGYVRVTVTDGTTTVQQTVQASGTTWTLSAQNLDTWRDGAILVTAELLTGNGGTVVVAATATPTHTNNIVSLPTIAVNTPVGDGNLNASEDDSVVISGTSTNAVGSTVTISVDDNDAATTNPTNLTATVQADGTWSVAAPGFDFSALANGSITITASVNNGNGTATGTATVLHDKVAPTLTVTALATAGRPTISGTTDLAAGSVITVSIDPDNVSGSTALVTYQATVLVGGTWSLDLSSATPTSGSLPTDGLTAYAKVTATATDAAGNSTAVNALVKPVVDSKLSNSATPTLTGTWANISGDTLYVVINGVAYGTSAGVSVTLGGNGYTTVAGLSVSGDTWTLTTQTLSAGTYNVTAYAVRGGSQAVDTTSSELTVDTSAPSVAITGITNDTGTSSSDYITSDTTLVFTGTAEANASVLVVLRDAANNIVFSTTVIATGGVWSLDRSGQTALTDGTYTLSATATDLAGNSTTATQSIVVDTTGPQVALTFNSKTTDTTPVITGTSDLPSGTTITVDIDPNNDGNWGDKQTYTTTVQPDGTWSVEATTPLSGTVGVRATGVDFAGNSVTTLTKSLEIVVNAPSLSITTPLPSVGVDNIADAAEDDAIVILGSTANVSAGVTVNVTLTDGTITISDTATVAADGSWSLAALNLSALANGTISVTAVIVDTDGTAYTSRSSFTHDKSAIVAIDSISEDTGVLADFITKDNTVSISGSATAGASVSVVVKDAGNSVIASFNVTASGSGTWTTATTSALVPGSYTVEATVGVTTATKALTIVDATPPTLTTSSPVDNATSIAVGSNLVLTFSKNVQPGSGYISLYRADGTLIENFNVATGVGDQGGTLVFNGTTGMTLDAHSDLANGTGYYLHIDSTAVMDSAGNAFAGISDSTTLNFTTIGVADTTPPNITGPSGNPGDATAAKTINENTTAVATLTANETVTWSLVGGADQAKFTIDSTTGVLRFLSPPDYETPTDSDANNTYIVQVRAVDGAGNASTQTITVTVADVDDTAPAITGPSGNAGDATSVKTINENITAVATLTASESVTWSIVGGTDQAKFSIDSTTGALRFISAPDYETPTDSDANNTYLVQVRAVDGSGNASTQTITVTVADLDEVAPVITGPSGNPGDATAAKTVNENSTTVATLTANETVTWSIVGGVDQAKFAIDSTTGALRFVTAPDFELPTDSDGNNTYLVQVRAVDAAGNASTQTITVTVADVNETIPDVTPPLISGPSGNAGDATSAKTVNENTTAVATLTADEAVTWSIVGGIDQAKFSIDSNTGALRFISAPDFETPTDSDANNTYLVQVRAVDSSGNASTQTITVTVANIDDTAPLITGPSGNAGDATSVKTINENTTAVTTLTANEPVTWSIVGGADQAKFTLDPATGVLRFVSAPDYEVPTDSDGNNTYLVQIRAVDTAGNASTQTITVTVADVIETVPDVTPPLITGPSGNAGDAASVKTINENTTTVTTLTANEPVTWSIVGGADQAKFTLDPTTGVLRFVSAPDYETPTDSDGNNTYLVQIRAVDTAGNASTQTITVTVADVIETIPDVTPPLITGPSGNAGDATAAKTINENTTAVTTLTANEPVTWSIVGGADQAKFTLDPTTGVLRFVSAPDYEAPTDSDGNNTYLVQIRAVDTAGNASTQTITVTVADVIETIPDVTPPLITGPSGNAGDATAAKTINENTTAVTTLTANEPVTWSIAGGADQAKFTVDSATGVLRFVSAPDYEAPTDSDRNNTYLVQIRAVDAAGNASTQTLTVTVANVAEGPVAPALTDTTVEVGSALSPVVVPAFTSGDGLTLRYSATLADGSALPAWLTFNPTTRTFSGTPPAGTSGGDLSLKVVATDGTLSASSTFVLKVTTPTAPSARADTGAATEASGVGHTVAGTDATGNVLSNDTGKSLVVTAAQPGSQLSTGASNVGADGVRLTGSYGTLVLQADGSYRYMVDNTNAKVVALNTGESLTETFTYRVTDKAGQTATATLTLTVNGVTDTLPPVTNLSPTAPTPDVVVTPPVVVTVQPAAPSATPVVQTSTLAALPVAAETAPAVTRGEGPARTEDPSGGRPVLSFELAVIPSDKPSLVVYRGVPDQFHEANSVIRFTIPPDAFAHDKAGADVVLTATLLDGSALPEWLVFDRINGTFSGVAPRGFTGELQIKVLARDVRGLQAEAVFRFYIGKSGKSTGAKQGLSKQMRSLAYLSVPSHGFTGALK